MAHKLVTCIFANSHLALVVLRSAACVKSVVGMTSNYTTTQPLLGRNILVGRSSNSTEALQSTAKSSSTETFTTALYLNAAVFALEILAFTLLRRRFKAIYEPRTYIPPAK